MSKSIYTAMTAARARLRQLDAASDNLAKSSTPGHRQTRLAFDAALVGAGTVLKPQVQAEVVAGTLPLDSLHVGAARGRVSQRQGGAIETGRPLDVMLKGDAYLVVAGKNPLLTRDGRLRVGANGRLELASGEPVLVTQGGREGTLHVPDGAELRIDADGSVFDRGVKLGRLAFKRPSRPAAMTAIGQGLLDPGGATVDAQAVEIQSGWLEGSNVDPLRALVEVIAAQRGFELAQQVVKASSALDRTSARDLAKSR